MAYVMVCDDDEDFASAVAKILGDAGHEVSVELETTRVVSSMEQRRPDLLILDVMFPESSSAGFDLARAIHQGTEELRRTPILMLTAVNQRFPLGFGTTDIDDEWMPVADFLEKPVDLDVLCNRVEALLRGAGADGGDAQA